MKRCCFLFGNTLLPACAAKTRRRRERGGECNQERRKFHRRNLACGSSGKSENPEGRKSSRIKDNDKLEVAIIEVELSEELRVVHPENKEDHGRTFFEILERRH